MGMFYDQLSYVDRLSISEGKRAGFSLRAIARNLGRAPSTISRDIKRATQYRPVYDGPGAFFGALNRRHNARKGPHKLTPDGPLFAHVKKQLRQGWSPLQIAGRLARMEHDARP
jgi:transposase, IS30 family